MRKTATKSTVQIVNKKDDDDNYGFTVSSNYRKKVVETNEVWHFVDLKKWLV